MKLSIITINLNNTNGLSKTIKSVISQTCQNFEYIIIDGASNDGSIDLIERYKDKITFWISEPDKGIYQAMNKGIKVSKGMYCMFLNSGDWLVSENVIERMLDSLPDCSIYYGNMLKKYPDGKIYRDKCGEGEITMFAFYRGTLNHSPALIKRSLFEKYGMYDENLLIVSDWKWYLNVVGLHNEPVKYTDLDVVCFDMSGISNTHIKIEKTERRNVLEELLPANILADYDNLWPGICQIQRINKYLITRYLFWIIERILFKVEKIINTNINFLNDKH